MHGVKVIPMPTPDKTVFFKNFDDFPGNPVLIMQAVAFASSLIRPKPIVGVGSIEVYGNSITVRALPLRATNLAPIESAR